MEEEWFGRLEHSGDWGEELGEKEGGKLWQGCKDTWKKSVCLLNDITRQPDQEVHCWNSNPKMEMMSDKRI